MDKHTQLHERYARATVVERSSGWSSGWWVVDDDGTLDGPFDDYKEAEELRLRGIALGQSQDLLVADLTVTIHNEGSPEELTEIVKGEPGGETVGYLDPENAEEYVRRINTQPDLLETLRAIADGLLQARKAIAQATGH